MVLFQSAQAIEFDRSVTLEQQRIVERDLENLCRLNYDLQSKEAYAAKRILQMVFEIEEVNCATLRDWLQERVKWITGDFKFKERVFIQREEPTLWDSVHWYWFYIVQERTFERAMNGYAFAMNLGGELIDLLQRVEKSEWISSYRFGEFKTWFKFIRDDGRPVLLPIATPRVGIISLARDFFLHPSHPNPLQADSLSNSLYRMGLLFHEARHSDGHGEHLIFPHDAPCSQTDLMKESEMGCDSASNGAYGIEFAFLNYAIQTCERCNPEEKEILIQRAVVTSHRINMKSGKFLDPKPIEIPFRLRQLP